MLRARLHGALQALVASVPTVLFHHPRHWERPLPQPIAGPHRKERSFLVLQRPESAVLRVSTQARHGQALRSGASERAAQPGHTVALVCSGSRLAKPWPLRGPVGVRAAVRHSQPRASQVSAVPGAPLSQPSHSVSLLFHSAFTFSPLRLFSPVPQSKLRFPGQASHLARGPAGRLPGAASTACWAG